jgi:tetratricopeptide (TPR) repeat protein
MSSEHPFISHFSPQWTDPRYLEEILVQRGDLLAESVASVRNSVLTDQRRHLLFIGPRGAGKTHLVTLIQHRLSQDAALTDRMRVAWLNEDETATSFLRLLIAIYRSLSERYPKEFPAETISKLAGKDPKTAEEQLTHDLLQNLDGHIIVCLMENLDSLFRSLSMAEQRNWRAFLQNHPVIVTVGTAQALFDGIADHDEPFFGFFDTRHLQPLSVDDARELLGRIATLQGRTDLADFLRTPTGRARVDAIRALAGGNPRLYLIFSDLLVNAAALDDLVRPFEEMVDRQLTSYYQERLRWLSPQQREIVQFLCRANIPVPVKHIAEGLFTTHNSITGQLKQLREFRYVDSHPLGREVLYELAEPLMRLALQVKETHDRRPLALIVDFLRIWHEEQELAERLAHCPADSPARAYLETAHRLSLTRPNLRHELFRRDLDIAGPEQCDDIALEKARTVAQDGQPTDLIRLGHILNARNEWDEAIQVFMKVIEHEKSTPANVAMALRLRGSAHYYAGRLDQAIRDYTSTIEQPGAPSEEIAKALYIRGAAYAQAGRTVDAIADYSRVIELRSASAEIIAEALNNRGYCHDNVERTADAIADYTRAIELQGAPPEIVAKALRNRGLCHRQAGRIAEAIADFTHTIELLGALPETVVKALVNRGIAHWEAGRTVEEINDYTQAIEMPGAMPPNIAWALNNRAFRYAAQGKHESVLCDLRLLFTLPDENVMQEICIPRLQYWTSEVATAIFAVTTDAARWTSLLIEFAGYFSRFGALTQLGEAAVKHLPTLSTSPLNHAAWDAWIAAWEAARASLPTENQDQLDIPLRLLRTGIAWLKDKNDAHLLTLPREERLLLREAIELPPET